MMHVWLIVLLAIACQVYSNDVPEQESGPIARCLHPPLNESDITADERKVINGPIHIAMKRNEKVLLYRYFSKASFYFEFGCGGSTLLACNFFPNLTIRAMDSSKEWIDKISNDTCVKDAVAAGRMHVHWADIGAVGAWGKPATHDRKEHWQDYSDSIKHVGPDVDFVLVDGRFRVASCLKAILYTDASKTTLAIHDFFNRPHYHIVLKYADVIDCQDNLVILKKKAGADMQALGEDISKYAQQFLRV